ncbi:hypothetical protein [Caproiciproducens sp.]
MNCHIPVKHKVTRNQAKTLNEYLDTQKEQTMRRFFKLMCVALHQKYNFGHDRLAELLCEISNLSAEAENDEIFWDHIDRVIKELKLPFDKEDA